MAKLAWNALLELDCKAKRLSVVLLLAMTELWIWMPERCGHALCAVSYSDVLSVGWLLAVG